MDDENPRCAFDFHLKGLGGTPLSQVEPRQCNVLPACSDNIV